MPNMLRDLSRSGFAVLLGLAVIVPLLNYYRVEPSPTLYSEVAAGALFLMATAASAPLLAGLRRVHASFFFLVFGLLGVLVFHLVSERFEFAFAWPAWAGYLLLFFVAAALGQLSSEEPELRALVVDRLTYALVIAALANAVSQTAQVTGWAHQIRPFAFVPGADQMTNYACSPAGNVAQLNHANALAWLGIASLVYLLATKRCSVLIGLVGLGILLLSSAFTSSRMAWLMALALAAIFIAARGSLSWSRRFAIFAGGGLILGLLAATLAKSLITGPNCVTALDRVVGSGTSFDYWVRIELMRQALMVWWSQPILGVGVGKFMATTFALEKGRDVVQPLDYFPHNALLEILASFGAIGAGLVVICAIVWLHRAWRHRNDSPQQWPVLGGLAVMSIHAMLEMPLWYLYFLIPFGLMLGVAVGPVGSAKWGIALPWRWLFVGAAFLGLPGLGYALVDHARAERIIWLGQVAKNQPLISGGAVATMQRDVPRLTVFAIAGERELLRFAEITRANAPMLAAANRRLMQNIPDPVAISRQVMLEAIAGRPDEARDLFRRLMMFFPSHYELLEPEIRKRAEERPDETGGLIKILDEEMARPPRGRGKH